MFQLIVNGALCTAIAFVCYKLLRPDIPVANIPIQNTANEKNESEPSEFLELTLEELLKYDGDRNPRILIGILGDIFDVTASKRFYGTGMAYGVYAGKDASRGLATMDLNMDSYSTAVRDHLDGLTDDEMTELKRWHDFYREKYKIVGKVI